MFRQGDKLVCVDNSVSFYELVLYNTYIFDFYPNNNKTLRIVDSRIRWVSTRFISLKEYRKQKLDKICLI